MLACMRVFNGKVRSHTHIHRFHLSCVLMTSSNVMPSLSSVTPGPLPPPCSELEFQAAFKALSYNPCFKSLLLTCVLQLFPLHVYGLPPRLICGSTGLGCGHKPTAKKVENYDPTGHAGSPQASKYPNVNRLWFLY